MAVSPGIAPKAVIIGGGHAGVEAAAAVSRMGLEAVLVTHSIDTIGAMSCNPAIGGIGKGHLVREIDALDGLMGRCADIAGIHYRVLNTRKGPAVRATRAQSDRELYRNAMRKMVKAGRNIQLVAGEVVKLGIRNHRIRSAVLRDGSEIECEALVLTVGTFLAGKMHTGKRVKSGGRAGAPASTLLAKQLNELDLPRGRLKTGTPPRLDGSTIDYSKLAAQPTANPLPSISLLGPPARRPRQVDCHLTATTAHVHDIVRSHLDQSPTFSGAIDSAGPRYCPSIEDKVTRFPERASHRIFLEPEGLDTTQVYPNGISTALPAEAQQKLVASIPGLESARINRLGYAIEYDYYDPKALGQSLEVPSIAGLFFAGQINGTTGYEEAAAQGMLAGINAGLLIKDMEAWTPGREESYLGVLVDDLTSQGVSEPYRMFTSRAEFRLRLREDNADLRLTETGHRLGVVGKPRWIAFSNWREKLEREVQWLQSQKVPGSSDEPVPATQWLRRPEASLGDIPGSGQELDPRAIAEIEASFKYAGLLRRQDDEVRRQQEMASLRLEPNFDFDAVHGLSSEAREKLQSGKPATLGQAARIRGITPAAIAMLRIHLDKRGHA